MPIIYNMLKQLDRISPAKTVHAHCDIPCGIYDPHGAQIAAHTIIRMNALITEFAHDHEKHDPKHAQEHAHKLARCTFVKEQHAEICERELQTLWVDYFKPEHIEKYDLHDLFWKTMKLTGKTRQEISPQAAQELLENVMKIAEIFWETKGVKCHRIPAPYPSGGEIVMPR